MLLHYLGKLILQIFCRYGRKCKQIAFLIASNFAIHPQILIFQLLCHCSFTYLLLRSNCGIGNSSQHTSLQRLSTVNMVLNDEVKILIKSLFLKRYTPNRLTDEFPEKSWTKLGVNKLFKKLRDTPTPNRRPGSGRPRSASTEENAKLLLQKFPPQSVTDFVLPTVRWSDREHLFVRKENKVSGILQNFWSRSLAHFMRAAQCASVSSCARHLLKH